MSDTYLYFSNGIQLHAFNITQKSRKIWNKQGKDWTHVKTQKLGYVWIPINELKKKGYTEVKGRQLTKMLLTLET